MQRWNILRFMLSLVCTLTLLTSISGCSQAKQDKDLASNDGSSYNDNTVKQSIFIVKAMDPDSKHKGISMFDACVTVKDPSQVFKGSYEYWFEYKYNMASGYYIMTEPIVMNKLGVVSANSHSQSGDDLFYGNRLQLKPEDVWFRVGLKDENGLIIYSDDVLLPVDPEWAKTQLKE